jgi:hypothetical protein
MNKGSPNPGQDREKSIFLFFSQDDPNFIPSKRLPQEPVSFINQETNESQTSRRMGVFHSSAFYFASPDRQVQQ